MKYNIIRTDTADAGIRKIILYVAQNFGNNVVIGAGSVVTKDIPDWTVAVGNPCRVIRKITDDDRKYYYKDRQFDEEAWQDIVEQGLAGN